MKVWRLNDTPTPSTMAVMAIVGHVGRESFASNTLAELHNFLGVDSWSVYTLWPNRPPEMHLSGSEGMNDRTGRCFEIYRDRLLYKTDSSFAAARDHSPVCTPVITQMSADEAPSAEHRDAIYRNHGILERLSVAQRAGDGSIMAVNAYRHRPDGCTGAALAERFIGLAPVLMASVTRHVEWCARPLSDQTQAILLAHAPALTTRELAVLERIARGMTYDGIAEDLRLSTATVKTYRARAFRRLGINFKSQLFALLTRKLGQA